MSSDSRESTGAEHTSVDERIGVFLCYRREGGGAMANALRELLETASPFRGADGRNLEIEVFQDVEQPGVPDWQETLDASLQDAHILLVVCTRDLTANFAFQDTADWVHHEIDYWCRERERPPILVPAPGSDLDRVVPRRVRERWPRLQCLPPFEPGVDGSKYQRKLLETLRLLIGEAREEKVARQARELRQKQALLDQKNRLLVGFAAAIVALVVGASWLAFVLRSERRLRVERDEVAGLADSRRLAALARNELDDDPALALILSVDAFERRPTREAREMLYQALSRAGEQAVLEGHRGRVTALDFSEDGARLLSGGIDGCVRIWSPSERRLLRVRRHGSPILYAGFLPGDELAFSVTRVGEVHVFECDSGDQVARRPLPPGTDTESLRFPDDRRFALSCSPPSAESETGEILRWDIRLGTPVAEPIEYPGGVVELSGDGSTIALAFDGPSRDESFLTAWRGDERVFLRTGLAVGGGDLLVCGNGTLFAYGTFVPRLKSVRFYRADGAGPVLDDPSLTRLLSSANGHPFELALDEGGRYFHFRTPNESGSFWDQLPSPLVGYWRVLSYGSTLSLTSTGNELVEWGPEGAAILSSATSAFSAWAASEVQSGPAAIEGGGRFFATSGPSGSIRTWRANVARLPRSEIRDRDRLRLVLRRTDRSLGVARTHGAHELVDLETGRSMGDIAEVRIPPESVEYSPGGKLLIASADDGASVAVFDANNGAELLRRSSVISGSLVFDDRETAAGLRLPDGAVEVWDLDSGECVGSVRIEPLAEVSLALRAEPTRLAVAQWGSGIGIYEVESGGLVRRFECADPPYRDRPPEIGLTDERSLRIDCVDPSRSWIWDFVADSLEDVESNPPSEAFQADPSALEDLVRRLDFDELVDVRRVARDGRRALVIASRRHEVDVVDPKGGHQIEEKEELALLVDLSTDDVLRELPAEQGVSASSDLSRLVRREATGDFVVELDTVARVPRAYSFAPTVATLDTTFRSSPDGASLLASARVIDAPEVLVRVSDPGTPIPIPSGPQRGRIPDPFSPDGSGLLVWGPGGELVLADTATGEAKWRLPPSEESSISESVDRVLWSACGRRVLLSFSGSGRRAVLCRVDTGRVVELDPIRGFVRAGGIGPNGEHLLSFDGGELLLWSTRGSREPVKLVGGGARIVNVSFIQDESRIVATHLDGTLSCRELPSGREVWSLSIGSFGKVLAIDPTGRRLALIDDDGVLWLVRAADGEVEASIPGAVPGAFLGPASALEFDVDGGRVTLFRHLELPIVWDVEPLPRAAARRARDLRPSELRTVGWRASDTVVRSARAAARDALARGGSVFAAQDRVRSLEPGSTRALAMLELEPEAESVRSRVRSWILELYAELLTIDRVLSTIEGATGLEDESDREEALALAVELEPAPHALGRLARRLVGRVRADEAAMEIVLDATASMNLDDPTGLQARAARVVALSRSGLDGQADALLPEGASWQWASVDGTRLLVLRGLRLAEREELLALGQLRSSLPTSTPDARAARLDAERVWLGSDAVDLYDELERAAAADETDLERLVRQAEQDRGDLGARVALLATFRSYWPLP